MPVLPLTLLNQDAQSQFDDFTQGLQQQGQQDQFQAFTDTLQTPSALPPQNDIPPAAAPPEGAGAAAVPMGSSGPPPAPPAASPAPVSPPPDYASAAGSQNLTSAGPPSPATAGSGFSPYDNVFRQHAGDLANDPEFIKIVAAGTKAESNWDAGSTTGDGGHSWGLFQMHDAGAGAGMGNARLDPNAASAVMVPRYADAYRQYRAQGLTGSALAAAVAQSAERSADPTGSAYAAAYRSLTGGTPQAASSPAGSPQDQFGTFLQNLTSGAQGAAQTVGNGLAAVGNAAGQAAGDAQQQFGSFVDQLKSGAGNAVQTIGSGLTPTGDGVTSVGNTAPPQQSIADEAQNGPQTPPAQQTSGGVPLTPAGLPDTLGAVQNAYQQQGGAPIAPNGDTSPQALQQAQDANAAIFGNPLTQPLRSINQNVLQPMRDTETQAHDAMAKLSSGQAITPEERQAINDYAVMVGGSVGPLETEGGKLLGQAARALSQRETNFLRTDVLAPTSDLRPPGWSDPGLPNVKSVQQANLGEVVPEGSLLYHQTSVPNARVVVNRFEQGPRTQSVWTSDNPDLALGQGGKGVLLEIDPALVNGSKSQNPAKALADEAGQGAEYMVDKSVRGAVQAIYVKTQRQLDQLATDPAVRARFDIANPEQTDLGIRIARKVAQAPDAISGTQGGQIAPRFATTLGGGAAGGLTTAATTDPNDPNYGLKVAGGTAAGAALGYGAGRLAEGASAARAAERASNPANQKLLDMYAAGAKADAPTLGDRWQSIAQWWGQNITDDKAALQQLQDRAAKAKGAPLTAEEMAASLSRLDANMPAKVNLDDNLAPALQSVGEDRPWLSVYLTHLDNLDVAKAMGNDARKFSGGLSAADSQQGIAEMRAQLGPERMAGIEKAAQQVQDFNRSLLKAKVDAGIIPQSLADELERRYPNYVPTRITDYLKDATDNPGLIPNGKSLSVRSTGLKANTIEGTTKAREDPLASTVRNAYATQALAQRNRAFNGFVKDAELAGRMGVDIRPVPDTYVATRDQAKVTGFVNGERQTYVMPKALANMVKTEASSAIPGAAGTIWRGLMYAFKAGATSRNPLFLTANALNDAAVYSIREASRAGGPQNLPKVLGELVKAYGDAFQGATLLGEGTYKGAGTRRFLLGGGGQSGVFSGTEGATRETVENLSRTGGIPILGPTDLKGAIKDVLTLRPVSNIGERIELAPRVAAMRLAEQRGANPVQAVINGRNVTVDFSQGGTLSKVLNQFIPFFNAQVQGTAQIARAFNENPKAFTATVAALVGAPALAAEAWNRSDPQRAQDYADVPSYIKDQGIVVMLPVPPGTSRTGDRKPEFFYFPLREFAPLGVLTREAAGRVLGDEPRNWDDLVGGMLKSTSPISGGTAGDTVTSLVPLGLSTGVQLATNQDYFRNRQIVSKNADENAAPSAQMLSLALEKAGIQAHPSQIEFLARDLGSGVAGAGIAGADMAVGGRTAPSQEDRIQATPGVGGLVGRFVRDSTGQAGDTARQQMIDPSTQSLLRSVGVDPNVTAVSSNFGKVTLRPSETTAAQQRANGYVNQGLREVMADPDFRDASPDLKARIVGRVIAAAKRQALGEIAQTLPDAEIERRMTQSAQQQQSGPWYFRSPAVAPATPAP